MKGTNHSQVIVEVSVIDDGGIEHLGVRLHNRIRLLGNHAGGLAVLGVDCTLMNISVTNHAKGTHTIMIQIADDSREALPRLLMQI